MWPVVGTRQSDEFWIKHFIMRKHTFYTIVNMLREETKPSDLLVYWKKYCCTQGRSEVRWRPGQEASLAFPCSNLRSFGSTFTVLKKVLGHFRNFPVSPQSFGPIIVIRRPRNFVPLHLPGYTLKGIYSVLCT